MNMKGLLKRAALALTGFAMTLMLPHSARTKDACEVERGIDPLDVINLDIRHNVWIVLDTSGSMAWDWEGDNSSSPDYSGESRLETAKEVLEDLILNRLLDNEGDPLFNYGFMHFDRNNQNQNDPRVAPRPWMDPPDTNYTGFVCPTDIYTDPDDHCTGIIDPCDPALGESCAPPACQGDDNRATIVEKIRGTNPNGWTPNGEALLQIAERVRDEGRISGSQALLAGQKNYVIMVTDGGDTCECYANTIDTEPEPKLRGLPDIWTPNWPLDPVDPQPWNWRREDPSSPGDMDREAYNSGIKANAAYEILNELPAGTTTLPDDYHEVGNTFVIGIVNPDPVNGDPDNARRLHHLAWEASGASKENPNARGAFLVGENRDQFVEALLAVFAKIGVPDTSANLGTSLVGSVKELIPKIPGLSVRDPDDLNVVRPVNPDDVLGDVAGGDLDDVTFARRLRSQLRNNVMFHSSFDLPEFHGHLKAFNVYRVEHFEDDNGIRYPDFATDFYGTDPDFNSCDEPGCFWDAGVLLQDRYASERTILFNRRGDLPGTPAREFCHANEPGCSDPVTAVDLGLTSSDRRDLGAKTPDDAVEIVVRIIRGEHLSVHTETGTFYRPDAEGGGLNFSDHVVDAEGNYHGVWKLWDPINVGATVVQAPPRSPDMNPPPHHDYEYGFGNFPDGFYWDNFNRETLVYLPTNAGLIHAFRAVNGHELFAYIPPDVLGDYEDGEIGDSRNTLKDFVKLVVRDVNGILNHVYLLAAAATAEDVFLQSSVAGWEDCGSGGCWHTALVFGRGKGGKFITSLDVTLNDSFGSRFEWLGTYWNMARLDVTMDPLPRLMFNVGNRQGISSDYDGLGETWSIPVMGNVQTATGDQWVAFAGGGFGCVDMTTFEGQFLYVLRMEDGAVYQRYQIPNDPAAPIEWNGVVATPTLYNPHQYLPEDPLDYVAQLYFGDLQGKIYKIDIPPTMAPDPVLLEPWYELGTDQPITVSVALFRANTDVWVFAGTGGDYRVDSTFMLMALNDVGGTSTDGLPLWGEPYRLPNGERVIVPPVVGGETIFFSGTRTQFDIDLCRLRFYSSLYAIHVESGLGSFDLDPTRGGEQESMDLGEGKVTGLFFRDNQLYVSRSGAIGTEGDTLVIGDDDGQNMNEMVPSFGGTVQVLVRGFRLSPF